MADTGDILSFGDVTSNITVPPNNNRMLRNAIDAVDPTTPWITDVSAVNRVSTSVVIRRS